MSKVSEDVLKYLLRTPSENPYFGIIAKLEDQVQDLQGQVANLKKSIKFLQYTMENDDEHNHRLIREALDVPNWIHYLAKDTNGVWWGFDMKPVLKMSGWDYQGDHPIQIALEDNSYGWETSLRRISEKGLLER